MKINLNTIATRLRRRFPDATIDVEDYDASQWLNVKVANRAFTVEARHSLSKVGFSEITEQADFGGHDASYPYSDVTELSNRLVTVIGEKIDRPQKIRAKRVTNSARMPRRGSAIAKGTAIGIGRASRPRGKAGAMVVLK